MLPYAIDEKHNNIYILLGQEKPYASWHDGGTICDFGGSVAKKDSGPHYTAAREFHEETCAIVRWDEDEQLPASGRSTYVPLAKKLATGQYTMRMLHALDNNRVYVCYLKQIRFDPSIPHRVQTMMSTLRHVRSLINAQGHYVVEPYEQQIASHPAVALNERGNIVSVNRDYLEKQSLSWVSLVQLEEWCAAGENPKLLRESFRKRVEVLLDQFKLMLRPRWEIQHKISHQGIKNEPASRSSLRLHAPPGFEPRRKQESKQRAPGHRGEQEDGADGPAQEPDAEDPGVQHAAPPARGRELAAHTAPEPGPEVRGHQPGAPESKTQVPSG